ncbi:MAG: ABC transporter ATP-binding protein/permease [Oscillospiraceae bacterium]|nr:ABC transporter ATP-binding protein/permease [Oscillospiraceae bacterium]
MLELKNVKKTYKVGEIETKALNGISMAFREREFVAILGASGSGKTTCLNIIGGLDRYDSGEMAIKGKKTASFKDRDWDAYRNNSVGFVFQSYNLITHLSIVANVELGMTLSGVSTKEKRERTIEVLTQVGLKDHLHKKPNQLSGGQMQRVAIARALANNPEILLCDEPTGALDTKTSQQIMDLIRELSKERLVIMVTHNPEIAEQYADRTIKFEDGLIIEDTNPHIERPKEDGFSLKKTAMSFATALRLSGNNILTKKGRTFLTAFASSIGIIGIAVILSLSNGFQMQIDQFEENALSEFPIIIMPDVQEFNHEEMQISATERREREGQTPTEITVFDRSEFFESHHNIFSDEYLEYIENISPDIASSIGKHRMTVLNVLRNDDGEISNVSNFPSVINMLVEGGGAGGMGMMGMGLSAFPESLGDTASYLERNYELLYGELPSEPTDLVMMIGREGRLDRSVLENLGFYVGYDGEEGDNAYMRESISFDEILNTEFRLIRNNDFFTITEVTDDLSGSDQSSEDNLRMAFNAFLMENQANQEIMGTLTFDPMSDDVTIEQIMDFLQLHDAFPIIEEESEVSNENALPRVIVDQNNDYEGMWNADGSIPLRITGIFRASENRTISVINDGIVYSDSLLQLLIEDSLDSDVVQAVTGGEFDVSFTDMRYSQTMMSFLNPCEDTQRDMIVQALGGSFTPIGITIYPTNFESKDTLLDYLDAWNSDERPEEYHVIYTDMAGGLLSFMSDITHAIAIVLIAFASISLVVSLIMIAIITYISVLERTKEIGILRALGARKKDVTRVFNAETFIIGACSGLIGVFIAWGLTFPANIIIEDMTNLPNVAQLNILHVIGLLVLSTTLTVLGGSLPARMASKKDAVEALRSD